VLAVVEVAPEIVVVKGEHTGAVTVTVEGVSETFTRKSIRELNGRVDRRHQELKSEGEGDPKKGHLLDEGQRGRIICNELTVFQRQAIQACADLSISPKEKSGTLKPRHFRDGSMEMLTDKKYDERMLQILSGEFQLERAL